MQTTRMGLFKQTAYSPINDHLMNRRTAEIPTWQYHIPIPCAPLAKRHGRRDLADLRQRILTARTIEVATVCETALGCIGYHRVCKACSIRSLRIQAGWLVQPRAGVQV